MRALVTGATGALGQEVMVRLRVLGYDVVPAVRTRGRDVLPEGAVEFDQDGDAHTMTQDIIGWAIGAPFDWIVHCAGSELVMPLARTTDEQMDRVAGAARAAMAILRAAARPGVMGKDAAIVMMSSVAAHRGVPCMAAYSGTKAFIEAACRSAAIELAPRGIRVNCVAAGGFAGGMNDRIQRNMGGASRQHYQAQHPMGLGMPEQVADTILHLLLRAGWVTGATWVVDGGYLAAPGAPLAR